MKLAVATYAYPEAPTEARAALAGALVDASIPGGVFVLTTCLRTEVVVVGTAAELEAVLDRLFPSLPHRVQPVVRTDEAAAVHLFRVAAGLDSPIVGEREILQQFRAATRSADERGIDPMLAKLLQGAVATARQVHAKIPFAPHDSIAAVAANLVSDEDCVAVLGAGIMARAVARQLVAADAAPKVIMVARSPERVTVEGIDVWPFERAKEALADLPAVVSATSAKQRLVERAELNELLARRTSHLTLIDMAMPPDFDPDPSHLVQYIDIDELADQAAPQPRVSEAEELACVAAADMYHRSRSHGHVSPVIESLIAAADEIVDESVSRFRGKLDSSEDEAILRQAAHTVARKLLAAPVAYLNNAECSDQAIDAISAAFGVEE